MANTSFAGLSDFRDLESINAYDELTRVQGFAPEDALEKIRFRSRDNARTPMQWDGSPSAGFTSGEPWIAINPDRAEVNVAAQRADPDSVLNHYRRLIALRGAEPLVVHGRYAPVDSDPRLWVYRREAESGSLVVLCNFSTERVPVAPIEGTAIGERLIGNYPEGDPGADLRPYEARVHRLVETRTAGGAGPSAA